MLIVGTSRSSYIEVCELLNQISDWKDFIDLRMDDTILYPFIQLDINNMPIIIFYDSARRVDNYIAEQKMLKKIEYWKSLC